jgi:hypothetical protein
MRHPVKGVPRTSSPFGSLVLYEGVCQAYLDERLPRHAESTGFFIDLTQQIHRDIDIDALNRPARAAALPRST